ncbi:hypothetical protein [Thermus sp.]|uniref:hypothetical protein n=1 Tax=Thermus sp. TaxID=275 RepID=UPI0025DC3A9A|nr:hypothetical protein [Thermus sp.]MCX7850855.1 hypothetical protein [Thermus sp.]
MPRGEHLRRIPPEERARRLGQEPLAPGEATGLVQVRGPAEVLDRFRSLSAKERGETVRMGLLAREVWESAEGLEGWLAWAERVPPWVWRLLLWVWRGR